MDLNLSWINILILFGVLQGILFTVFLLFNRRHPGSIFLAGFMFVLAYNGFETFNWSAELNFLVFDFFPFIIIFGLGPCVYLYLKTLLQPGITFSRRELLLHFSPVLFQFSFRAVIILSYVVAVYMDSAPQWIVVLYKIYHVYSEPASVLVFLGYLGASINMYRKTDTALHMKAWSRDGQQNLNGWIVSLLVSLGILGVAWPLTILAPVVFDLPYDVHYYPVELALVLFIYWIAMVGYHRTRVIYPQPQTVSPLSDSDAARIMQQLKQAMERDKLYLEPEMNLSSLARFAGLQAKTISRVLNQFNQTNFNDFVNQYRVQEVTARLADPTYQHLTISGIAFECGFNSQATFQRAFKQITGVSPRDYVNSRLRKIA